MLIKWQSDFWTYTTRHVGRADKRTRVPPGQSRDREAPETISATVEFAHIRSSPVATGGFGGGVARVWGARGGP